MTVLDLITSALRKLGVVAINETPEPEQAQLAFAGLNAMVEAWATERLMMYTTSRTVFPTTAGQQIYTIGPSGNWAAPRPMYINSAGLLLADSDPTEPYERPLHIIRSDDEWARVRIKGLPSNISLALYYQNDFPNGTVVLYPAPTQANAVAIYAPVAVSQFTALPQTVALPPGYARALPFNLAVEVAPDFNREASPTVQRIAMESKDAIKRVNAPGAIGKLRAGVEFQSNGNSFDWTTGELR